MNREEAAREIDNTACCFSDKRFRDAMHMAAAALREKQQRGQGCRYCDWIDITLAHEDEHEGPLNYCRVCGRKMREGGHD